MKHFLTSVLAVSFLLGVAGNVAVGASSPDPSPPGGEPGPVYIDSVEILYLESFPVQVRLAVTGSLPTPCHEAIWEVQDFGESIDVRLWSLADPDQICVQVLEPFEISIPLGSFESADLLVLLNGEEVGRVQVGGEAATGDALVGAGWSFGMCLGYCIADLAIDGDQVVVTGRGRESEEPLFVNRGTLTADLQERVAAALEQLEGVTLEPVYGCPDCADGGAATLVLSRDGVVTEHQMEFGSPPAELAELHAIAMSIISALETCTPNELVTVADDCAPYTAQ